MSAPTVTILFNNSLNDVVNSGAEVGDGNFKPLDQLNDSIAFLGDGISNDDANSSKDVFVIPESGNKETPRQFVNDYSESKWKRIFLSGSGADDGEGGDNRYAYGAYIDGTTASAPILQAWDSTAHTSYNLEILGSGTPADSMLRAIKTTDGSPGANWAGTPIAGDGEPNSVALSAGAIIAPQMVYWNMRLLVPHSANPFKSEPILSLYLTYA